MNNLTPAALAVAIAAAFPSVHAQQAPAAPAAGASAPTDAGTTLAPVVVKASADASAEGLSAPFAGGQVAKGGRAGILGTKDNLSTPFSITSYTNELIQDRQAKSVGDVLQNDPTVRTARGFGNFQESYFIRGFILGSDDVAYNGLYGLLPRQYIATELFERVEVLRGASTFLTGANPGSGGIGGSINLLPKRAPNEALTRVTLGVDSGGQGQFSTDVARRFGPDDATGIRVNGAWRDGGTAVDDEKAQLGLLSVGLDWRSRDVRLSGDIGYQDNRLKQTRPNVDLGLFGSQLATMPTAPDSESNFAQPWSYSNERDLFGTLRGEFDVTDNITAWAAYGLRRSNEANSLANLALTDGATGDGVTYRFDNTRQDKIDTGEVGLRGKARTGSVGHEWVLAASSYQSKRYNAYQMDFGNLLATNLYSPSFYPKPTTPAAANGNYLDAPGLTGRTILNSLAIGDTLSLLEDKVLVTLGVRFQSMQVDTYTYEGAAPDRNQYDTSNNSPALGVVYKFAPNLSAYANYIEALVAGSTAPATASNAGAQLAPYVSRQKEIGLKYEGNDLGAGIALFSTKKPRAAVDVGGTFMSDGEDRHNGVELTAYGRATRTLRVLGGLTWLDTKQETLSASTSGKKVIGVPDLQASIGAEWDVTGLSGLAIDGRVVYTGSRYVYADNSVEAPSWTRLDLGLRYLVPLPADRVLTLRARVDNVTNRDYWSSVGGYPGNGYVVVGAPRTFAVTGSVDF